jgi:hypothetical protein
MVGEASEPAKGDDDCGGIPEGTPQDGDATMLTPTASHAK